MCAGNEASIDVHGMLSRKSDLHAQDVVVLTVHHRSVHDSRAVRRGDEIGGNDRPGGLRIAALDRVWEQGMVRLADQFRAGKGLDDLDLVAQRLSEQVLGENQFLSDGRAAATVPALGLGSDADSRIGDFWAYGEPDVPRQRPRGGCPGEHSSIVIDEFELQVDRRFLDLLVSECDLVSGVGCASLGAEGEHLVTLVEQTLVEHLLERPPTGFDVLIVQRDVGVVEINPEGHPLGHLAPGVLVSPDALLALIVELLHAEFQNRLVAQQIEPLLHLYLHRQTMGVPSALALHEMPLHRLPTTDEILVRPRRHMVDPRKPIGRRRAFEEDEWLTVVAHLNRLLEGLLTLPGRHQGFFEGDRVELPHRLRCRHTGWPT